MNTNGIRYATFLALGTMVISGVSNFVNKIAVLASPGPLPFTFAKNALVAIAILGIIILFGKMRELRALRRDQWVKLGFVGVIGGSLPFGLYFIGLTLVSGVNAALIHKTLVLWVALFAAFTLRERLSRFAAFAIASVFLGNVVGIGSFTGFRFDSGELMILTATILWAVENIIAKKALIEISSITVAGARMVFGSALLFLWLAFTGKSGAIFDFTTVQWGWTVFTAALLLGYVLTWYTALKHAPATYVATLLVPATLITNLFSAVFVTNAVTAPQAISAVLFLAGTGAAIYASARSWKERNSINVAGVSTSTSW